MKMFHETQYSYESLKSHIKNLQFCGLYPLKPDASKSHHIFQNLYMRLILSLFLIYTVQQIIKVYQVRYDANRVMDTMFLLLTNSDSICKQIIFWLKVDRIEELLAVMKGPIFNRKDTIPKKLLLQTAQQAKLLLRVFNTVALMTCLLWVLYPTVLYAQGKPIEFAIWLPFDPNISSRFYGVIIYVWLQTSWLAYCNTTMDAFISFLFAQTKTQLSILKYDLENIIVNSKREVKTSKVLFEAIFERRFRRILLHYGTIIKFSYDIQSIFGGPVLYQFLVSGWIICTTAYRIVNINPVSMEFVSMIMYMCCILTELFLFCFFGNEVTLESEKLIESAYAMNWLDLSIKHRRLLIIFMERIKRHIVPKAGAMVPLSNSTFVSIARSSYTFYAFLKNTD